MNAMAMCYDPKVSYKKDLIFDFMNFNENFINRNEKSGQIKPVNLKMMCILATKSPNVLKMASNGC